VVGVGFGVGFVGAGVGFTGAGFAVGVELVCVGTGAGFAVGVAGRTTLGEGAAATVRFGWVSGASTS
jgi:hypothetical protein